MKCKIGEIRPQWMANSGASITEPAIIDPISTVSALIRTLNSGNSELP